MSKIPKLNLFLLSFFIILPHLLFAQINEKIDRGVVALTIKENSVYVGWRLLKEDPENVQFNIYRQDIGYGDYEKVNTQPVTQSTNYIDGKVLPGHGYYYKIKTTCLPNDRSPDIP